MREEGLPMKKSRYTAEQIVDTLVSSEGVGI
jgi:hypothetical protein